LQGLPISLERIYKLTFIEPPAIKWDIHVISGNPTESDSSYYAVQHPDSNATRPDTVKIMIRLDRPLEKTNQSPGVDTTWTLNMSGPAKAD
jgi:hypothetical protein